jgi:HEAT repeat protein
MDAARARLSVLGARAVKQLIGALEGGPLLVRSRVMPLLALIRDPRACAPLIAMLLDRNPRLREIAARCLARFPTAETVSALSRTVQRERALRVRVAAIQSLTEHYAAGRDDALAHVLHVLTDTSEKAELRLAACAVLFHLGTSERKGVIAGLETEGNLALCARAHDIEAGCAPGQVALTTPEQLDEILSDLAANDYERWNGAIHRLVGQGAPVVTALVESMRERGRDPEYCARAGMALKAMGPRRCRVLADALDELDEPVPLLVVVEVIGTFGNKPLVYRLLGLIRRLAALEPEAPREGLDGHHSLERVRARAHLELARIGSRVAIDDLRAMLEGGGRRVEVECLAALGHVGTKEEMGLLLDAWLREEGYVRDRIAAAVREIVAIGSSAPRPRESAGVPRSPIRRRSPVRPTACYLGRFRRGNRCSSSS